MKATKLNEIIKIGFNKDQVNEAIRMISLRLGRINSMLKEINELQAKYLTHISYQNGNVKLQVDFSNMKTYNKFSVIFFI